MNAAVARIQTPITDTQVLERAFERMQTVLKNEWDKRGADLPVRNMDEALVLASIVEKETGRAEERPLIAGVFVNRLRKGMRLQSDPTVIYGIGPTFDGNIRLRDLRLDTPYNTYTRTGLPPTYCSVTWLFASGPSSGAAPECRASDSERRIAWA